MPELHEILRTLVAVDEAAGGPDTFVLTRPHSPGRSRHEREVMLTGDPTGTIVSRHPLRPASSCHAA